MLKRIMTIVALMCAVAFQVNAQEADNGEALKKAEEKALKADKNKKDAKLQLDAAYALAHFSRFYIVSRISYHKPVADCA